ncbi:hypothetical protein GQ55_5G090900 [Panicum hallii var. hallii]|uniref:RING-CH-type domain-containing protein n=1 Tax=Panicum hallii var. hallii TaxID=1504633 RepID=A0A2T7DEH4_9POAL|nr:hypothetical protein GQ55_5G090900 [Panicum hallii var. hallii]
MSTKRLRGTDTASHPRRPLFPSSPPRQPRRSLFFPLLSSGFRLPPCVWKCRANLLLPLLSLLAASVLFYLPRSTDHGCGSSRGHLKIQSCGGLHASTLRLASLWIVAASLLLVIGRIELRIRVRFPRRPPARVVSFLVMVNDGEQSAITAATAPVEPSVERGRVSGGGRRLAEESSDEEEGSQRFSDAEDRSWHSHSRQGSALDSTSASVGCDAGAGDAAERARKSCVSECSLDDLVDLEAGLAEITKASPDKDERNCRICHLGLDSAAAESGAGIVLGCSCKDDLSCAHKQCAETWFKIRGNKFQ